MTSSGSCDGFLRFWKVTLGGESGASITCVMQLPMVSHPLITICSDADVRCDVGADEVNRKDGSTACRYRPMGER